MNKNYYDLQQKICIVWRCIKKMACLIFWITHHGPRWPISAEKRRLAPFFDRNWPPGPMMGDPKNQACQTRQTMKSTIPSVHPFKFDQNWYTWYQYNMFSFTENESQLRQIRSLQYQQLRQFWKNLRSQNHFLYTMMMQWHPNLVKNAIFRPRKKFRGARAASNY